jgi:hypothetical protein
MIVELGKYQPKSKIELLRKSDELTIFSTCKKAKKAKVKAKYRFNVH